jgi:hypothetical protein
MGFLRRRRTEKWLAEIDDSRLVDALEGPPLSDPEAQGLRAGAETRVTGPEAPMPAAWAQTGLDLTNLHDDVGDHERDGWAFTDALLVGYYVRAAQLAAGAAPPDAGLSAMLADPDPVAAAQKRLDVVRELAEGIAATSGLPDETWQEIRSWARWHGLRRSGERARAAGAYPAIPAAVPYEEAFDAGHALHYAQEAGDPGAEPVALTSGPLVRGDAVDHAADDDVDLPPVDSRADAEALLIATEELFVNLAAPSRLAVAALQAITRSGGITEDDPYYGAYVGIALFGYACRMSQDLDIDDDGAITEQVLYDPDGNVDYDAIAEQPERLGAMAQWVLDHSSDPGAVPELLGATPRGWQKFVELAARQLRLNLRRNGMPRRALPDDSLITDFLRLGYATRLLDEAAGERPMFKHEH